MSTESKISPAFEQFLADTNENDKRDAIVIYQAPPIEGLPLRGRLRELKRRLDEVKEQAQIQKAVEQKVIANYQEASRDLGYTKQPLKTSSMPKARSISVNLVVSAKPQSKLCASQQNKL